jgi:hypothetical protein
MLWFLPRLWLLLPLWFLCRLWLLSVVCRLLSAALVCRAVAWAWRGQGRTASFMGDQMAAKAAAISIFALQVPA